MLLNISDFMNSLKMADECPNFFLNVAYEGTELYNDMTYSQCVIQLTTQENITVGGSLSVSGVAEGYYTLNKNVVLN